MRVKVVLATLVFIYMLICSQSPGQTAKPTTTPLRWPGTKANQHQQNLVMKALEASGAEQSAEVVRLLSAETGSWKPEDACTQEAYFLLAKAYQSLGEWDKTQKYYSDYLRAAPNGIYAEECGKRLGIIHIGYWDKALQEIRDILSNASLDNQKRYSLGKEAIAKANEKAPEGADSGDLYYAQGVLAAGVNRSAEARKAFNEYRSKAPNGRFTVQVSYYLAQLDQPRILFVQGGRLRSVLEDGSGSLVLTAPEQGEVSEAVLSPSRDYAAVQTWSESSQVYTIYILNLRNPDDKPKSIWSCAGQGSSARKLSWSPSLDLPRRTQFLAFVGPDKAGDYAVWVYDVTQTDPSARRLAHSETPRANEKWLGFSWAPEGKFIAFSAGDGRLYASYPPFTTVLPPQPDMAVHDPSTLTWVVGANPDSVPVLFGLGTRGAFMLDGKTVNSGKPAARILERVSKGGLDVMGVSSEGDVIAVRRKDRPLGTLELFRVNDEHQIGSAIQGVTKFEFSPIGGRLAYRTSTGIFVSSLDEDRQSDVRLSGTDGVTDFAWSPYGNQVLWWRKDRITLCFDRAQLGGGHLSLVEDVKFSTPKWAADDRAVVIQRTQGNTESLLLLLRGDADSNRQIRSITLNDTSNAYLVDWVN